MTRSYLDHNATTPPRPETVAAVARALAEWGNPSSVHEAGRAARRVMETARMQVAGLVGAAPADVVFTSGGTEANTLALRGCGRDPILVSAVEHPSVLEAAERIQTLPVDGDGIVDLDALRGALRNTGKGAIVSIMLANNETGVIQPVSEAAALAHEHGALVHCDAVQAAARMPVDFRTLGVDVLSLSAHKMGGPKGVGALIVADHVRLAPIIRGGGQERGRRSGTENLPGIAGFGVAAASAEDSRDTVLGLAAMRDALETRIAEQVPAARVIGGEVARLGNTSCLALPGVPAETQLMHFDLAGIAVSAGSACSSGKVKASHVLRAMGLPDDIAGCAIRVSLGDGNDSADIDRFVAAYRTLAARVQAA